MEMKGRLTGMEMHSRAHDIHGWLLWLGIPEQLGEPTVRLVSTYLFPSRPRLGTQLAPVGGGGGEGGRSFTRPPAQADHDRPVW